MNSLSKRVPTAVSEFLLPGFVNFATPAMNIPNAGLEFSLPGFVNFATHAMNIPNAGIEFLLPVDFVNFAAFKTQIS